MVSHANTNPGLTKAVGHGRAGQVLPVGQAQLRARRHHRRRTRARPPPFRREGPRRQEVLRPQRQPDLRSGRGQGVRRTTPPSTGIEILGNDAWDAKQTNYTALFQKIKAAGADCVYLGGIYDNNGGQLVKDKVAGPRRQHRGQADRPRRLHRLPGPAASCRRPQGMYLTFAGLSTDQLRRSGGAGAKLLDAYKAKYGADPASTTPLYGVAAMQVILEAIAKSDGTRKGVSDAVFTGAGITIPATESVLGKEIKIDPATGDVNAKDITVEHRQGQQGDVPEGPGRRQ